MTVLGFVPDEIARSLQRSELIARELLNDEAISCEGQGEMEQKLLEKD